MSFSNLLRVKCSHTPSLTSKKWGRKSKVLTLVPSCQVEQRGPAWFSDFPQWPPAQDLCPELQMHHLLRLIRSSGLSGWTLHLPEMKHTRHHAAAADISLSRWLKCLSRPTASHLWLVGKLLLDHSFQAAFNSLDGLFQDVIRSVHQRHRVASRCSNLTERNAFRKAPIVTENAVTSVCDSETGANKIILFTLNQTTV